MWNSVRRLRSATPFTSPDVEHTNRRPQATIRFFSIHSLVGDTRGNMSADSSIRWNCAPTTRQSARSVQLQNDIVTLPRPVACQSSMRIGAALSAAHPLQNEHAKPASTFNMGRRIMAERRRHRRERQPGPRPHARATANNQIDERCDETLRAFVRVLARQAARELFEAQLKRHSSEIH